MAIKTRAQLLAAFELIRAQATKGGNTPGLVGQPLKDLVDSILLEAELPPPTPPGGRLGRLIVDGSGNQASGTYLPDGVTLQAHPAAGRYTFRLNEENANLLISGVPYKATTPGQAIVETLGVASVGTGITDVNVVHRTVTNKLQAFVPARAVYLGQNFDTTPPVSGIPLCMVVRPNGTRYFLVESILPRLRAYNMTGGQVATSTGTVDFDWAITGPLGLAIDPSGVHFYVIGGSGSSSLDMQHWTAATPWLISSLSFANRKGYSGLVTTPGGCFVHPSGTHFFVAAGGDNTVKRFPMSTPWDLSTITTADQSFSTAAKSNVHRDLKFSPDGQKMFTMQNGQVWTWNLPTAWSLSGATLDTSIGSWNPTVQDTSPRGFDLIDGVGIYMSGGTTTFVYQYSPSIETVWEDADPSNGNGIVFSIG